MSELKIIKTIYYEIRYDLHPPNRFLVERGLCDENDILDIISDLIDRLKSIKIYAYPEDLIYYVRRHSSRLPYYEFEDIYTKHLSLEAIYT
jgi:hypothetical protein